MARVIRHPLIERILLSLKTAKDWIVAKLVGLFLHCAKKLPPSTSINAAEKLTRPQAEREQPGNFVYRVDPDDLSLAPVADGFTQPNGLAFSRDETKLYIAESGSSHDASVPSVLKVFDAAPDGALSNPRVFAEIDNGLPDGFRVDRYDNVWCSAEDGVHVFAPTGDLLGKVYVPERVANLTFGGERGNVLFITATTSVYSLFVNTSGC